MTELSSISLRLGSRNFGTFRFCAGKFLVLCAWGGEEAVPCIAGRLAAFLALPTKYQSHPFFPAVIAKMSSEIASVPCEANPHLPPVWNYFLPASHFLRCLYCKLPGDQDESVTHRRVPGAQLGGARYPVGATCLAEE